uniref:Uncharacterized protein n=1 Tax=Ciona savignyi TaxID=51511 RepID=H2YQ39_CIOSA
MCLGENIDVGENIDDEDAFSIPVTLLTSEDVNNMSLAIWKDIKLIQDSLGAVMSKVVKTFGILDTLVKSREVENSESKLYSPTIKQLELQLKFNEEKHRKEVDSIKATWQKDIRELNDSMELVLEDNQRLALMLTEHLEEPMYKETYEVGNSKDERIGQMGSNCNELNNYLESESFQTELHNENINVQANDTNKSWSDNFPHFQNLNQHSGSNNSEPFSTTSADTSTQSKMNGLHREH